MMTHFYFCIIFCQLMIHQGSSNSHSKETLKRKVDTNEEITEYEAADVHYPDKVKLIESNLINLKSLFRLTFLFDFPSDLVLINLQGHDKC